MLGLGKTVLDTDLLNLVHKLKSYYMNVIGHRQEKSSTLSSHLPTPLLSPQNRGTLFSWLLYLLLWLQVNQQGGMAWHLLGGV